MKDQKQNQLAGKIISAILNGNSNKALTLITGSGFFLNSSFDEINNALIGIDYEKLIVLYPQSKNALDKIFEINAIYILDNKLKDHQAKLFNELLKSKTNKEECLELLLFICHLSSVDLVKDLLFSPGRECLEGVQFIYDRLPDEGNAEITIETSETLFNLLHVTTDIIRNKMNFELIVDNDYTLKEITGTSYEIHPLNQSALQSFRAEAYKKEIEWLTRYNEADHELKNEDYIKHIDKLYNSDKGMPGVIHSSNVTVKELTPGLTALPMEDDAFSKMVSHDPKEQLEGFEKVMGLFSLACFHSEVRDLIRCVYNPALKINIKYPIKIGDGVVLTVYELFLIMGAVLSRLGFNQTFSITLNNTICNFQNYRKEKQPNITDADFKEQCIAGLLHLFIKDKQKMVPEIMLISNEMKLVGLLMSIKDLEERSDKDLLAALLFLSKKIPNVPYNLLYKSGTKYYAYAFKERLNEYPKLFYKYFVTDKMFGSLDTTKTSRGNSNEREKRVCEYLVELFSGISSHKTSNINFPLDKFGELNGEKDFFAYSEKENILFYGEVKLSNVFPRKTIRKKEWITNSVFDIGHRQIKDALSLLSFREGLDFLGHKIGVNDLAAKKPKIFSFLITDCYYSDHSKVDLPNGSTFTVINIFELENVIKGKTVHHNQKTNLDPIKPGEFHRLIETLNDNVFWEFIQTLNCFPKEEYELKSFNKHTTVKTFV